MFVLAAPYCSCTLLPCVFSLHQEADVGLNGKGGDCFKGHTHSDPDKPCRWCVRTAKEIGWARERGNECVVCRCWFVCLFVCLFDCLFVGLFACVAVVLSLNRANFGRPHTTHSSNVRCCFNAPNEARQRFQGDAGTEEDVDGRLREKAQEARHPRTLEER